MGSEKNSDRQSQEQNWKEKKLSKLLNDSKSDIGFNGALDNIDNSRRNEDENRFLDDK